MNNSGENYEPTGEKKGEEEKRKMERKAKYGISDFNCWAYGAF